MRSASDPLTARVVRVLPDEPAIDKTFDYLVPESLGDQVRVGTRVRIALSGRRVGGWVVAVDVVPPPGVKPRPLAKVSGHGPGIDLIDLAHWAAWRWAGRPASFLRTANPDRVITALPSPARPAGLAALGISLPQTALIADALGLPPTVAAGAGPSGPHPHPPGGGRTPSATVDGAPDPRARGADSGQPGTVDGAPDPGRPGDATAGDRWASGSSSPVAPASSVATDSPGPAPAADDRVRVSWGSFPERTAEAASGGAPGGPAEVPRAAAVGDGAISADPAGGPADERWATIAGGEKASSAGEAPARGQAGDAADGETRVAAGTPGATVAGGEGAADRVHVGWGSFPEGMGSTTSASGAPAASGQVGDAASGGEAGVAAGTPWATVAGGDEAAAGGTRPAGGHGDEAASADGGRAVVRWAPAVDPFPLVRAAAGLGNALVICPTVAMARSIGMRLRRDGVGVAFHPRDWAAGAAGATVVGPRAAAWAPVARLAAVVVLDEHDERHAQEQAPTWHARDVVAERARRAGVPCVLVSPCPSLEALVWGRLLAPARNVERAGWPIVDVVDRRDDDPRTGLFSPRLVDLLRSERRVVCVLNRTGRAKLLACAACGELARCEACDAALSQTSDEPTLACPRCGTTRPVVCGSCGGTRLKLLRQGVSRVREELEALVGEPVDEVSSLKEGERRPTTRVVVGTEAVLHQVDRADVVAFLDLDQELLAARYRAVEQALGLVARAARLVGGKDGGGRLVLQTRVPRHEVVQAALHGDPDRVAEVEADRRELLRFPPAAAMAEVSGPAAEAYIAALRDPSSASPPPSDAPPDLWSTPPEPTATPVPALAPDIEILGPADGRWLVRAPDHTRLCDTLATVPRPPGRLRLAVDPLRI